MRTKTNDPVTAKFRVALGGLAQHRIAKLFDVSPRHIRRWRSGNRRIPHAVGIVCNLLTTGVVTIEQIEAAVPTPARTNGRAKPKPLASLEEAPEQAKTAALAVCALAPNACRWPVGDLQRSDFRFCGRPAITQPYCEQHRAMAYVAPLVPRRPAAFHFRLRNLTTVADGLPATIPINRSAHLSSAIRF